jgi:hypothetical protein
MVLKLLVVVCGLCFGLAAISGCKALSFNPACDETFGFSEKAQKWPECYSPSNSVPNMSRHGRNVLGRKLAFRKRIFIDE